MRPFKQLRIIGKRHRIQWDQDIGEQRGEFEHDPLTIRISSGLTPDDEKETLIHEITHAVELQMNLDLPEDAVRQLSIGLFAVLRDNPKLAAYLMEDTGDE